MRENQSPGHGTHGARRGESLSVEGHGWRGRQGGQEGGPAADLPPAPPHPAAMEVWCQRRIPVEGNFGQTYDSLNRSIHDLEGEFSATIELKVGSRGAWAGGSEGAGEGHGACRRAGDEAQGGRGGRGQGGAVPSLWWAGTRPPAR